MECFWLTSLDLFSFVSQHLLQPWVEWFILIIIVISHYSIHKLYFWRSKIFCLYFDFLPCFTLIRCVLCALIRDNWVIAYLFVNEIEKILRKKIEKMLRKGNLFLFRTRINIDSDWTWNLAPCCSKREHLESRPTKR